MIEFSNIAWLLPLTGGFAAGVGLGLLYFLGLWATIRKLTQGQYTSLWVMASLVLRLALVLIGFYFLLGATGWQGLLAASLGFTLMRILLTRRLRPVSPTHGTRV